METSSQKKWLAVFPGQGAQHVGMAKSLHEQFKVARETFEEASDAIKKDLRKLCFDGPESDLVLTENTQPALLTASIASFRVAQTELGFKPALVAGHSLGEYSALVAAGALPLSKAAAWVRERGAAMQKAVPAGQGTMAAVLNLDEAKIDSLCALATEAARAKRAEGATQDLTVEAIVQPANFNSPGQIVIAGSTDAVAEAISLIKAGGDFAGAKALPLQVSAPFHCQLMKPARERMAELFRASPAVGALSCEYIPNRTARVTREAGVVLELLVEQVDHPVLWRQSMTAALSLGLKNGVEFGPGKVLQGLMKRIASHAGLEFNHTGLSDADGVAPLESLLKA
jgi:[acyl-carrier-protein] S-malonyltransferase